MFERKETRKYVVKATVLFDVELEFEALSFDSAAKEFMAQDKFVIDLENYGEVSGKERVRNVKSVEVW